MQCQNQVKQLTLALHTYHDAQGSFPAARINWNTSNPAGTMNTWPNSTRFSAFVPLTPFFEQTPVFEAFTYAIKVRNAGNWTTTIMNHANYSGGVTADAAVDHELESIPWGCGWCVGTAFIEKGILSCPSDKNAGQRQADSNTVNTYRFCYGDSSDRNAAGFRDETESSPSSGITICTGGVVNGSAGLKNDRGFFTARVDNDGDCARNTSSISDGTSNTIVFSETCISSRPGITNAGRLIKGSNAQDSDVAAFDSGGSHSDAGYPANVGQRTHNVRTCWGFQEGDKYNASTSGNINATLGNRWADNCPVFTGFMTIFPPNSLSCAWSSIDSIVSASSYHTGGVVVGFGDGAVQFVNEMINAGDPLTANVVVGGESEFGVWGALGSINGGEAKMP
ncbi:general secretion pathway protein GspG [Planctomycetales bacterium]|nr:general secretion pathway protein GspG [Planctomycetales bacterium]